MTQDSFRPLRFLVTGGTRGIGAAVVEAARQLGHHVVFTGRDSRRLQSVADATGAWPLKADIASPADNLTTVDFCREKLGGVDVLINNAGYGYMAPIGSIDMDELRRLFDTNLFGLIDLTNRVVPLMLAQNSGDIVNIASTSGIKGHENGTAYCGTKWALRGISQSWQAELRRHNIRVTCVCPSEVQTEWYGRRSEPVPNKLFASDIADAIMGTLALKRRVLLPEFAVFATNPWARE